jgi:hypothetical protein
VLSNILNEVDRCKKTGFSRERFDNIKKSYYGSLVRDLNDVETLATVLINSGMDKVSAFSTIELVANVTLDDVMRRLETFDTDKVTLSIIQPK